MYQLLYKSKLVCLAGKWSKHDERLGTTTLRIESAQSPNTLMRERGGLRPDKRRGNDYGSVGMSWRHKGESRAGFGVEMVSRSNSCCGWLRCVARATRTGWWLGRVVGRFQDVRCMQSCSISPVEYQTLNGSLSDGTKLCSRLNKLVSSNCIARYQTTR